jgi:hypothetical protein
MVDSAYILVAVAGGEAYWLLARCHRCHFCLQSRLLDGTTKPRRWQLVRAHAEH